MKRRAFFSLGVAGLGAWYAPRAYAGARTAAPDFSWLDARLRERVALGYFDGMGLMLGRGESVLHEAYVGNAGPDVAMHVASTGKWTAAATIASVVDEGKLGWDDPVRKFLPQFTDSKGDATLRQLLSHTAGYPDYQPQDRRRDDYQTLEESVAHIVALPAVARPGERFQYGGLAMQVAGRMAEVAARQSFDALFQNRIAGPLGMRASGYSPVSREPGFSPMLGGSLFTSTHDYGRFLMMVSQNGLYKGKRVLSARAIAEMQADQTHGASIKRAEYVEAARQRLHQDIYGLGLWREEVDRRGAPLLLSSPGWAGACAWLDKASGVWGVVVAKANVEKAVADGYSTFMGSTIYAPMVRTALEETARRATRHASVAIDGATLYYEESGAGRPVIFLHGHSFDRRQWQPQIDALERDWRVIRYDLRGYGRSGEPREGEQFLHADDLRQFMDALGIARAHLVGLSLGGFVVTDFIALYPERALSATMAGGDLFDIPGPDEPWSAEALATRRGEIAALRKAGVTPFKQQWLDGLISHAGSGREALRQPLWRMIDEWPAWQALHVEPRLLLGRSAARHLAAAKPAMPVLIVRGDQEKMGFPITALLPQAVLEILPDCGHVSNLERPALFTAALVRLFGGAGDARRGAA
ncbi:MAG: alpha/beta fold hydrolase [Massilia sp.]